MMSEFYGDLDSIESSSEENVPGDVARRRKKQKTAEKKRERRLRREDEQIIESILNTASIILNRYRDTEDPVLRHSLLIDKFIILIDVISGMSEVFIKQYNPRLKTKLQTLIKEMQTDFNQL